jgi:hypothetical protein
MALLAFAADVMFPVVTVEVMVATLLVVTLT